MGVLLGVVIALIFVFSCNAADEVPAFLASDPASVVAWNAVQLSHSWGFPMRALVTMKSGISTSEAAMSVQSLDGAKGVAEVQTLDNVGVMIVNFHFNSSFNQIRDFIDSVIGEEFVETIEGDSVVGIPAFEELERIIPAEQLRKAQQNASSVDASGELIPNDPLFPLLWNLDHIKATDAWGEITGAEPEYDASRPVVTVIDTGVDYNHPDLQQNIWTNEAEANGQSGVDDDGNGYIDDIHGWNAITNSGDAFDDHWHGTHCAGTIGAVGDNFLGIVGVSWAPLIQACKFLDKAGRGSTSNAIRCIDYSIATGAAISSNSWGSYANSIALEVAIYKSSIAGQLFVAAAGNSGQNTDDIAFYPAGFDLPNIVTVAAIHKGNALASFSNYGPSSVDIAAPGQQIGSTYPNSKYAYASGTSMAAPHIAGAAALVVARSPLMTYSQIMDGLKYSVQPIEDGDLLLKWKGTLNLYALVKVSTPDTGPPPVLKATLGPSTASCAETCAFTNMNCDESATSLINTDLDACFDAIVNSGTAGYWAKGTSHAEPSYHPFGCYTTFSWSTNVVNVNTNVFGGGGSGCLAPNAELARSFRACYCSLAT